SNGKSSGSVGPELPRSEQSSEEEEELPKKELPKLESERAELPPASAPPDKLATKPKSSQHRVLKIVATVANKSPVQTPNGYIYQFELVLHEATGLSIKWQSVSARKISFAGKSSPVKSLVAEQNQPNSTARYRVVVKMTGTCIEDWYGQLITISMGED